MLLKQQISGLTVGFSYAGTVWATCEVIEGSIGSGELELAFMWSFQGFATLFSISWLTVDIGSQDESPDPF